MTVPPPKIDPRTYEEIVADTIALAKGSNSDWQPTEGQIDAGLALIRIFGHMVKGVSDRLNQVPDKNFLAFLDLIGTRVAPPQPARVPLTFSLVDNSPEDAFVPAGTPVAAPATETAPEVVYELEQDLVVVRSRLIAAFSCDPKADRYSDHTAAVTATTTEAIAFAPFQSTTPISCLYLACDDLLTRPGAKTITLNLSPDQTDKWQQLSVDWAYWDADQKAWHAVTPKPAWPPELILPTLKPHLLNGQSAAWLRAQVSPRDSADLKGLSLTAFTATANVRPKQSSLLPDQCFFNTLPLDLSKPFYPFGEQPKFNDTFYIASREVFGQPGANVTMEVAITSSNTSQAPPETSPSVHLTWEYWDGITNRWMELGQSNKDGIYPKPNTNVPNKGNSNQDGVNPKPNTNANALTQDTSKAFTAKDASHQITFTLPVSAAVCTVNGEENHWIRVRISQGDYGKPAATVQRKDGSGNLIYSNNIPVYEIRAATFNPPIITSFSLGYTLTAAGTTMQVMSYSNFTFRQPAHPIAASSPFQPFALRQDAHPALYLGFHRPLPNRALALYLQVAPLAPRQLVEQTTRLGSLAEAGQRSLTVDSVGGFHPGQFIRLAAGSQFQEDGQIAAINHSRLELTANLTLTHLLGTRIDRIAPLPQLVWEYASPRGWQSLGAIDDTEGLTQRGLVRFLGPTDWVEHSDFGQRGYWLRLRWAGGEFLVTPQLRRVLTNTVWAAALVTLTDEGLGSSTGNPNQRVVATQAPVLPGECLEVKELLPSAELAALEAEDKYPLTAAETVAAGPAAYWVQWQEVLDFYGSGPRDRHYRLNRLTGEITFGDGFQGLIPPLGQQNIRLRHYRTGGGSQGNRPAHSVQQLKTTVPYVNGVTNYEAASGAAPQEALEQVKERGPKQLRHRNRAVTAQDIEDLTFEASPAVARAMAIAPTFSTDLAWLPVYHLPMDAKNITLSLTWNSTSTSELLATVYGPGQATAQLEQKVQSGKTDIELPTLNPSPVGAVWRLVLSNPQSADLTNLKGTLDYGTDSQVVDVPRLENIPHHQDSTRAGRVDLVIVPRTDDLQPTPSLGLLHQIETYVRQRCSPTLHLHVTEPHWVKVTVTATLVPTSFQAAEAMKAQALRALTEFLNPLTGGHQGKGWEFGRRPHESDLYAVLGKVAGVDHVKSDLQIDPNFDPSDNLPPHYLIFSGSHSITSELS